MSQSFILQVERPAADSQANPSLKEEGNKLFGRKEYQKALEAYDKALKAAPDNAGDQALLHSNKAACYMMFSKCASLLQTISSHSDMMHCMHISSPSSKIDHQLQMQQHPAAESPQIS